MDRAIGHAAGGPAAGRGATAVTPATSPFRTSFTCASCAPTMPTAGSSRSTRRPRAPCRAWSRSGPRPTSPTCRRSISAKAASPRSIPTASRCWRPTACAMSASRSPRCSPSDPYVAEDAADLVAMEIEELPIAARGRRAARRIRARPRHRGRRSSAQGYGDVDAALRAAPVGRRARARDRPPFRRAAGDPRRHRPLRRRARSARAARRRQGAAPQSRAALAHARAPAVVDPRARVPRRRRLRHPRRALSGGRAGLRRRHAARPAGEMDRGPARAPDRGQSFAPAAASHSRGGRRRRPHPRDRRRLLPRPGRLCAHPRRARRAHDRGHAARALPRAGLSRGRAFPPDQQDAGGDLSRARAATRPPSCASAWSMRSRRSSASIPSRCAGATPSRRTRCPITGRSKRSARRSSTIPATMSGCSTSSSPRSTGTSSRPTSRAAAPAARRSAPASRCSWRRAGSAPPTACASRSTPRARSS